MAGSKASMLPHLLNTLRRTSSPAEVTFRFAVRVSRVWAKTFVTCRSARCLQFTRSSRDSGLNKNREITLSVASNCNQSIPTNAYRKKPTMPKSNRVEGFNRLFATSAEREDCSFHLETFKGSLFSSAPPDSSSYSLLEKSLRRATDPRLIIRFCQEVMEITLEREPFVINRILFILGKIGHRNTALHVFEYMKNTCKKMDLVTFNTILSILGKHGEIDRMIAEFNSMKELGYDPDHVSYNTLINSLRRFGRVSLCSHYLKEMEEREIRPDVLTYTSIIDNLGRAGHVNDAVRVHGEMKNMSIRPSVYVFRGLVGNLRKAGKLEMADTFQEEMKSSTVLDSREIEERKGLRKNRFLFRDWKSR